MRLALLLSAAACMIQAPIARAQVISGSATAIDGDTLEFTGIRFRLAGIDAPELAQTCLRGGSEWACGKDAAELLRTIAASGPITCTAAGVTSDAGPALARCHNGADDLSAAMAAAGLAIALPGDAVAGEAEARARRFGLGLWSAQFDQPETWRLAHPAPKQKQIAPVRATTPRPRVYRNEWGCAIKGNWSRRGDMIYHLPGMKHYDQTRAEAFFCTEPEALAAGYRRSKD